MRIPASIVFFAAIAGFGAPLSGQAAPPDQPAAGKPNILWLIAEDLGPQLGCYGTKQVWTPNLDRLAEQGVRYTHFYNGHVCSPSRSAFNTGMYATTIGAHNHRTTKKKPLPEGVKVLSDWMRDAGYFTTNLVDLPAFCGFKGTGKTDWNFVYKGEPFDSTAWSDLKNHQPFYAQLNFRETHRTFKAPRKADPAKVEIPPYYPDHPVTREDWAKYLDSASELDRKIGFVLDALAADGLAENTIVVFFGDNGQSHVRGKQFCYEEGLLVPLIIRWPKSLAAPAQLKAGTVDGRLIHGIDLAPTMLALAEKPKPPKMQGQVFLGDQCEPDREYVFGYRDRCDMTQMRIRTVRDNRYRYIRNFTPWVPFLAYNEYKQRSYPVWNLLQELNAQGKLTPPQQALCRPSMPEEELYDLEADPWEVNNLAKSEKPEHKARLARLRSVLEKWIVDTDDQGRRLETLEELKAGDQRFVPQRDWRPPPSPATSQAAAIPAFPGAEGFGKHTKGGRGGDVYVVSNLHDDGPGSFRRGLVSAAGPRTIVFDVSGTIVLRSPIQVEGKSHITIAGQTSPGKGITLRENQLAFKHCQEIIVRYLRLRLGDENKGKKSGADVMTVNDCDNVVLDHLSLSWGIDGNSDYRGNGRMTLQWLLYSEALNASIHYRGSPHAMATSIRDCRGPTTVHHNIYSTSRQRHPTLGSGSGVKGLFDVILDYRNCVDYNWSGETNFGGLKINAVGNYYKPGPCTDISKPPIQIKDGDTTHARGFMAGNFFEGMPESFNKDNYTAVTYANPSSHSYMSTTRGKWEHPAEFDMGPCKPFTQDAKVAYEFCLKHSGCSLVRDAVDERVINNISNGVGRVIDSQKEVGGWDLYPEVRRPMDWDADGDGMPDGWENAHGLDPRDPDDRNGDRDGDGYTNLEEYLNGLVPDMTGVMHNISEKRIVDTDDQGRRLETLEELKAGDERLVPQRDWRRARSPATSQAAAVPAFPGAWGGGMYSTGGRGGKVIAVTNLDDHGPGSLRDAVEADGPRTVVFRVSGTIDLQSGLLVTHSNLTIAGQTAPGDGICLKRFPLKIRGANDVIVRFLRVRPGDESGLRHDGIEVRRARNVVLDHCSVSWSIDEGMNVWHDARNVTVQWCMIAEPLNRSVHKGPHGFGASWGGEHCSYHHNLFAHCAGRNPSVAGQDNEYTVNMDHRCSVIYNWEHRSCDGKPVSINVVNNYYKPGPATRQEVRRRVVLIDDTQSKYGYASSWFVTGNAVEGFPAVSTDNWQGGVEFDGKATERVSRHRSPFAVAPVPTQSASEAYALVLRNAGATRPRRDAHDIRILREVETGNATFGNGIIDTQSQVGGWPELKSAAAPPDTDGDGMPDAWETSNGLDPSDAADGAMDADADGYTNVEEFLNGTDPRKRIDYRNLDNNADIGADAL